MTQAYIRKACDSYGKTEQGEKQSIHQKKSYITFDYNDNCTIKNAIAINNRNYIVNCFNLFQVCVGLVRKDVLLLGGQLQRARRVRRHRYFRVQLLHHQDLRLLLLRHHRQIR